MSTYKKFYKLAIDKLINYKLHKLAIHDNGFYKKSQEEYKHILPPENIYDNVISIFRKYFINYRNIEIIKLHTYFHHLNSSQALCINLFYPLCYKNKIKVLFDLMNIDDKVSSYKFEHIEDATEGTNFDFYVEGSNYKYFFELKYTEQSFGSVTGNKKYIKKYNELYSKKLKETCEVSKEVFFKNYQICRNIIYSKNGYVIFIIPIARKDLNKKILYIKEFCKYPERILVITLESLVNSLLKDSNHNITAHYNEFIEKYIL